jgi:transcriptional regulator with GAF, ATPase, and Fis domain
MPRIIGDSPALGQALHNVRRAATTDATVLLLGESGTGKELVARALHAFSSRARHAFVAVNCAAIPEGLLESEMFGYEKGAFTGAAGRKLGRFEMAHRGTLFLDEIGDLPVVLQAKILRAIEQKQFERLGGAATLQVDVRIVAATNHDLKAKVAAGRVREDLFFRLSVFPVNIPPLRARRQDIPLLARHFVDHFCREMKKPAMALSPAAFAALEEYGWPGNVRELQNCIERAVILAEGDILRPAHLNLPLPGPGDGQSQKYSVDVDLSGTLEEATARALAQVTRAKVLRALEAANGNRLAAAASLGIEPEMIDTQL